MPCSMRPVATVPRPAMVNTPSMGMRKGLSYGRTGMVMYCLLYTTEVSERGAGDDGEDGEDEFTRVEAVCYVGTLFGALCA
jgi:hypothetical protein